MIKLVCGIFFLMITSIHASEYLEDIDLEKAQKVLSAAKADQSLGATYIYSKIYTQARNYTPLKGSDSESLLLNLYFSACLLEYQETEGLTPENLSDNSYRRMLAPLGGYSRDVVLAASSLTGILSRLSGIFDRNNFWEGHRTSLQSSFSRLITGQGRFKLEESTEEKRHRLIMDIYRHYNLNDPMFGRASKRGGSGANIDLLWNEIVGDSLDSDKRVEGINATQEHTLSCFIVACLAASSMEYRLGDASGLVSYLLSKMEIDDLDKQQTINQIVLSFYDIISSQITSNNVQQDVLDAFYDANLQQDAQRNARLNQQFDILRQFDVSNPIEGDDGVPLLQTSVGKPSAFPNNNPAFLAHSLGILSFQAGLTSDDHWKKTMKAFGFKAKDGSNTWTELWSNLNESLSKNPLRKSLSSFLQSKIAEDKVTASQKRDNRYSKEKTLKQIQKEKDEKKQRELKAQQEQEKRDAEAQRLAAERRLSTSGLRALPAKTKTELKSDWNIFRQLKDVIAGLENVLFTQYILISFNQVTPNIYQNFIGTRFLEVNDKDGSRVRFSLSYDELRKTYKKLSMIIHPDKAGEEYLEEFKFLSKLNELMEAKFSEGRVLEFKASTSLWSVEKAERAVREIKDREARDGEERQRLYGASDYDGNYY